MKQYFLVLGILIFGIPFLSGHENLEKNHEIISLGRHNQPKHSRYEIGSIGGMRYLHNKIYDKGTDSSCGYTRRSTESITGLWTKIKTNPILWNIQIAYTYDTYKYDRWDENGIKAHARYHGYSISTIAEARYKPFDLKFLRVSPILGLSYKYSHQRAFSEKYADVNRHYEKSNLKLLQLRAGGFLERDFDIFSRKCWVYSKLIYTRTLDDSDSAVKYTIDNDAVVHTIHSNFEKKDGFEMSIGTIINVLTRWDIDISYQLFADGKLSSHAALWQLSYNF